ncbi:hypothetical protein HUSEC_16635, partial [Escherichia coli O104:H4 str. LB226692]
SLLSGENEMASPLVSCEQVENNGEVRPALTRPE